MLKADGKVKNDNGQNNVNNTNRCFLSRYRFHIAKFPLVKTTHHQIVVALGADVFPSYLAKV